MYLGADSRRGSVAYHICECAPVSVANDNSVLEDLGVRKCGWKVHLRTICGELESRTSKRQLMTFDTQMLELLPLITDVAVGAAPTSSVCR